MARYLPSWVLLFVFLLACLATSSEQDPSHRDEYSEVSTTTSTVKNTVTSTLPENAKDETSLDKQSWQKYGEQFHGTEEKQGEWGFPKADKERGHSVPEEHGKNERQNWSSNGEDK